MYERITSSARRHRVFDARNARRASLVFSEHFSSLSSNNPAAISGRIPGFPSLHPPTYSPAIQTDGIDYRPVSVASAGANPLPPSI